MDKLKVSPDYIPVNHNINKHTFELLKQLEVGDVVTVKIKEECGRSATFYYKKATITSFNSPWDSSPIVVKFDNEPQHQYSVPLSWVVIDDTRLRDIKIDRVISQCL